MKHYNIPDLPWEIDELLYDWQRAEILQRIESPIVTVTEKDPIWLELDDMLTTFNNIFSMTKSGEINCSVHELLPGINAVWIMDDMDTGGGSSPIQAILINTQDLQSLREGGIRALVQHHLFKRF
jgi:hypothetical protein